MQITTNISIMVLTAAFVSYCHQAGRQGSIANMADIVFLGAAAVRITLQNRGWRALAAICDKYMIPDLGAELLRSSFRIKAIQKMNPEGYEQDDRDIRSDQRIFRKQSSIRH